MWPSCLLPQLRGRLPSTTTIICLSLLMIVSGMAWKPSLIKCVIPVGHPAIDLRRIVSSTQPYALRKEAKTSPVMNAGTLHTVTRILRVPIYSVCCRNLNLVYQLWCSDFLTPPTPLIIPYKLPGFLESLMPLKNWCSIHARCSKSSLKHSIRFCGIFSKFKTQFYCISFF